MKTIQELSSILNVSSRTLRYWEKEGLIESGRQKTSNWRVYTDRQVNKASLVQKMRQLNFSISCIKNVIDAVSIEHVYEILSDEVEKLKSTFTTLSGNVETINKLLQHLSGNEKEDISFFFTLLQTFKSRRKDEKIMNESFKVVYLNASPMVYHIAVGESPEDDAMSPVIEYLKEKSLLATTHLYGGNMPPYPNENTNVYGYGMMGIINDNIDEVPKPLEVGMFEGGLYAMIQSTDDIPQSWKDLCDQVEKSNTYKYDKRRLCLEEHISVNTEYSDFNLILFLAIDEV